MRHEGRDYLMPSDGNPRSIERTAISVGYVTERLRRCGADNVVLFLDACRNKNDAGDKSSVIRHLGLGVWGLELVETTNH